MMKTHLRGFPPFPKPLLLTVPLGKAMVVTAASLTLFRHVGRLGGRASRPCLVSCHVLGCDFVVFSFFVFCFLQNKDGRTYFSWCWGTMVVDAYKLQEATG